MYSWAMYGRYMSTPVATISEDEPRELVLPSLRWKGTRGGSVSSGVVERVAGVGLNATLVGARLWTELGGLDESMSPLFSALDLCLRAARLGVHTAYVPSSTLLTLRAPPHRHAPPALQVDSVFVDRWNAELLASTRARLEYARPLIWSMECANGQVRGLTDEAIAYVISLEGRVDLRLEISDLWRCEQEVLSSLASSTREAILRMSERAGASRQGAILLLHRDPGRYHHFVTLKDPLCPQPIYSENSEYDGDDGYEGYSGYSGYSDYGGYGGYTSSLQV